MLTTGNTGNCLHCSHVQKNIQCCAYGFPRWHSVNTNLKAQEQINYRNVSSRSLHTSLCLFHQKLMSRVKVYVVHASFYP